MTNSILEFTPPTNDTSNWTFAATKLARSKPQTLSAGARRDLIVS